MSLMMFSHACKCHKMNRNYTELITGYIGYRNKTKKQKQKKTRLIHEFQLKIDITEAENMSLLFGNNFCWFSEWLKERKREGRREGGRKSTERWMDRQMDRRMDGLVVRYCTQNGWMNPLISIMNEHFRSHLTSSSLLSCWSISTASSYSISSFLLKLFKIMITLLITEQWQRMHIQYSN